MTPYQLNNVAVQQFHDMFINKLQQKQHKLSGTYQLVQGVVGDAYKWPLAAPVDMHERTGGPLSKIPNTSVVYTRVTTVFKDWVIKLETDKVFTQSEVNVNELNNFATQARNGICRRQDQILIDALNAASTDNDIPVGTTNLTLAKLREANSMAVQNNWPDSGWHIAIGASQLSALLNEEQLTSSDYNTVKTLVEGKINTFLNFTFHVFGDLTTGGLPKTGNNRTCFAWNDECLGLVYKVSPNVQVFPMNDDLVVPTTAYMSAGSDVLLPEGIIKIVCAETA